MKKYSVFFLLLISLSLSVYAQKRGKKENVTISQLQFISEYDVPHNFSFQETTVGGLSGIDYDKTNDVYYLICDDRSAINAARYYTAKIFFTKKKIDSVQFVNVTTLLQKNGTAYPNSKQDPAHTPDPEALRYDPVHKQMIWKILPLQ
jgi:hypothetical protein